MLLGTGQKSCIFQTFPRYPLADQLQRILKRSGSLVWRTRLHGVCGPQESHHGSLKSGKRPDGNRQADRKLILEIARVIRLGFLQQNAFHKDDTIFEAVISMKYDVPNDRLKMFDEYRKAVDDFYRKIIEKNG